MKNRLSKVLAAAGVASRRASEELIFAGVVRVNGEVVKVPQTMVDPLEDEIYVRGRKISQAEEKKVFILNKPAGYVCTNTKYPNQKTVVSLFQKENCRLFTVGRLDKDTTGLIVVTNDGKLANRIIHPSFNIQKEYLSKTGQEITAAHLKKISDGCEVEGCFVKPVSVKKIRKGTLKVVVREGKKREVRQLLAYAGLDVKELSRIRIGGLTLGNLELGKYRSMTRADVDTMLGVEGQGVEICEN